MLVGFGGLWPFMLLFMVLTAKELFKQCQSERRCRVLIWENGATCGDEMGQNQAGPVFGMMLFSSWFVDFAGFLSGR